MLLLLTVGLTLTLLILEVLPFPCCRGRQDQGLPHSLLSPHRMQVGPWTSSSLTHQPCALTSPKLTQPITTSPELTFASGTQSAEYLPVQSCVVCWLAGVSELGAGVAGGSVPGHKGGAYQH